jgi:hypothetical protein
MSGVDCHGDDARNRNGASRHVDLPEPRVIGTHDQVAVEGREGTAQISDLATTSNFIIAQVIAKATRDCFGVLRELVIGYWANLDGHDAPGIRKNVKRKA